MLQDWTVTVVKFWSYGNVCAELQETLKKAETAVQLCGTLRQLLRPLRSSARDMMPYSHSSGSYITTRQSVLSYSSLLQSHDSVHHTMA